MNLFVIIILSSTTLVNCLPILENDIEPIASNWTDTSTEVEEYYIDLSHYGNAIYGTPDNETTGQLIANYTPEEMVNPEELGSYLEGDIVMPRGLTRNGLAASSSRWPNGVIPFEIRGNFKAREMDIIERALNAYHKATCIKFVPRRSEHDYISIVNGPSGCWSSVGRIGGKQEVNLQTPGCMTKPGTAIHELMHAVGFLHEQNRHERDSFVTVHYGNIERSALSNFDVAPASKANGFGVPYDYGSVMHYSSKAFSSNNKPTITAKQPGGEAKMGQREGFSPMDIQKLNAMYNCKRKTNKNPSAASPAGHRGPNNQGPIGGPFIPPIAQGPPINPNAGPFVPPIPQGPQGPANVFANLIAGIVSGLGLADLYSP